MASHQGNPTWFTKANGNPIAEGELKMSLIQRDENIGDRFCFRCGQAIEALPYILLLGMENADNRQYIALHIQCGNGVGNELAIDFAQYFSGSLILWQNPETKEKQ